MEKMRRIVMNIYDIRHIDQRCNFPHCKKSPERYLDISEFTLQRNIGIAKIFLCKEHIASTAGIMKTLRKSFPDIIIQSKEGTIAQPGRAHMPKA